MASSKRQTTMAKMAREQSVKERRARKQQKKEDRKQATAAFDAASESMPAAQDLVEGPEGLHGPGQRPDEKQTARGTLE